MDSSPVFMLTHQCELTELLDISDRSVSGSKAKGKQANLPYIFQDQNFKMETDEAQKFQDNSFILIKF